MCRVILSMALVWSCAVGPVLSQTAGSRSSAPRPATRGSSATAERRLPWWQTENTSASATHRPPATAARPPVGIPGRPRTDPVKQFDRRPHMVMVQALIVTVSFGEGEAEAGGKNSPAGSLADALAAKINAEVGDKKTPVSALTTALDGVLKEKAKTASIETLTGLELVTVAGQAAFVQIGQRKPRITGTSMSQRGRMNQIQMENVGTILSITPQVIPDGSLVAEVDIERSDLAPEEEGKVIAKLEDGSEIRTPQIDTLTSKTTVAAANGQAVVVNDLVRNEPSLRKETFVILRLLVIGASDDR